MMMSYNFLSSVSVCGRSLALVKRTKYYEEKLDRSTRIVSSGGAANVAFAKGPQKKDANGVPVFEKHEGDISYHFDIFVDNVKQHELPVVHIPNGMYLGQKLIAGENPKTGEKEKTVEFFSKTKHLKDGISLKGFISGQIEDKKQYNEKLDVVVHAGETYTYSFDMDGRSYKFVLKVIG